MNKHERKTNCCFTIPENFVIALQYGTTVNQSYHVFSPLLGMYSLQQCLCALFLLSLSLSMLHCVFMLCKG
jgi:hypothetical protein